MISPSEQPESGVTNYFRDHTQGPACAMACEFAVAVAAALR